MAYQGSSPGPFFRYESGGPLIKARFVSVIKTILKQAGMDDSLYSGHSFCIGATTTAAQAGIADSVIKALGRWSSEAFLVYVRTPRAQLAQKSQQLTVPVLSTVNNVSLKSLSGVIC